MWILMIEPDSLQDYFFNSNQTAAPFRFEGVVLMILNVLEALRTGD
jgi:hypothetical protein